MLGAVGEADSHILGVSKKGRTSSLPCDCFFRKADTCISLRQIRIVAFSETELLPCCLKGFCFQSGVGCKYSPVTSTCSPSWAQCPIWSFPGSVGSMQQQQQQLRCPSHSPFGCATPASLKLDDERKFSNVDLFIVAFKSYIKQQHCAESSIFHLFGLFFFN